MEIEAKFLVRDSAEFDRALHAIERRGYSVHERAAQALVDRYFDTPDRRMLRGGWACRCRETGGQRTLSLKSLGSREGAVFVRDEIVQPLPADCRELPEGPVQARVDALGGDAERVELFRVENRRTAFEVCHPNDESTRLELCFDRAEITPGVSRKGGIGRLAFSEIEVELEHGEDSVVTELAEILRDSVGLVPSQFSKFERGMQAAGLPPLHGPGRRRYKRLSVSDPLHLFVYRYLQQQLDVMLREAPHALEGLTPEGVHKMRVALRRIRSLLRAFREMFREMPEIAELEGELRWLGGKLGAARDADICEIVIAKHEAMLPQDVVPALAPFNGSLHAQSGDAYRELATALSGARYRRLVDSFRAILDAESPPVLARRFGRLCYAEGLAVIARPAMEDLVRRGRKTPPDTSAHKLHRLRIRAKRLRYLLEFFRQADRPGLAPVIRPLKRLQDVLGEHQDAVTAIERIDTYADTAPLRDDIRATLLALGQLKEQEHIRIRNRRSQFPKAWKRFEEAVEKSWAQDAGGRSGRRPHVDERK